MDAYIIPWFRSLGGQVRCQCLERPFDVRRSLGAQYVTDPELPLALVADGLVLLQTMHSLF